MKETIYVIMNYRGVERIRKSKPMLSSGEVAVRVTFDISDRFFERFIPDVEVSIPDEYVTQPDIDVSVEEPEEPKEEEKGDD